MLYVAASVVTTADGGDVVIRVPGHEQLVAGIADADEALSAWLGERVRLTRGARRSRPGVWVVCWPTGR
jgi:hypothetical protein